MVLNEQVAPDLMSTADGSTLGTVNDNDSLGTLETTANNEEVDDAIRHLLHHNNSPKQVLATCKILHTLIGNASDPGQEDPKKKRVRLTNPKIKENIVQVEGAVELMELAGFVQRVEEHQEWLIFEQQAQQQQEKEETEGDDANDDEPPKLNELILVALQKAIKDLEAGGAHKKPVSKVVQRKKEKKLDRYLALQRWKDDTQGRNATVQRKFHAELQQDAKRLEEQRKGAQMVDNMRPYLHYLEYVAVAIGVFFFCHDPSKAWQIGLFLFVFYWISVIFVGIVDGRGGHMMVRA